jgi:hypothetical protein
MSQFLYYIPGASLRTLDDVNRVGLGYAFEVQPSSCGCNTGPDAKSGTTISADMDGVGYYPDRQTWRKIPGIDAWLGWYTDAMPGPADLERKKQIPGELVRLGDGRDWLVPVAIEWREIQNDAIPLFPLCRLPRVFHLEDTAVWRPGETIARYKPLEELGWQFLDAIYGKEKYHDIALTDSWACQASVCALAFNYRIAELEASVLGLVESDMLQAIARVITDFECVSEWSKKKQLREPSNTECGPPESTPASGQP